MEVNQTVVKHEDKDKFTHTVNIRGLVTVRQGDRIIFEQQPNHFVRDGLITLARAFSTPTIGLAKNTQGYFPSKYWTIGIGTNATPIIVTLTALGAQISNAPSAKSLTGFFVSSDNLTKSIRFLAVWGPGILNALLGVNSISEIGLYLNSVKASSSPYIIGSGTVTSQSYNLVCAISSAGANSTPDFTAFIPDAAKPVEVEWKIQVGFV